MSIIPNEMANVLERDRLAALSGTTPVGFDAVSGEQPKSEYFYEPGTEKSTRGAEFHNLETDVAVIAGRADINLMHHVSSASDQIFIKKTPKGHIVIYDDTAAGERILIKHLSGAGIEMKPDGSIIVNSRGNRVDLITNNHHLFAEGNGNLTYSGDLNMNIGGDFNLDVGGNYNLKVGGHWIVNIFGSYTKRIVGMMAETIQKVKSTTVLKDVTNTFLGKVSTSIKGSYEFVVKGEADYNHKGSATITSQTETTLTSPNINIVAQDLTLTGDTGTIGGENIVMFNYNMYTGHSITAVDTVTTNTVYNTTQVTTGHIDVPLVNGDLQGTAEFAKFADETHSQSYSDPDTHEGSNGNMGSKLGYTVVSNSTADTSVNTLRGPDASAVSAIKQKPTAATTSTFIDKSAYMVQSVFVDDDDGIYNYLDKTVATGGVTDRPLMPPEIRIKMRNIANKNNTSFIQEQIAARLLSASYAESTPPNVRRIVGKSTQTRMGSRRIGAPEVATTTTRYKAAETSKKRTKFIMPEAQYNPNNISSIKMGTLLSPGMPVSKFFPNNETMNHLNQIERHRIARNLVAGVKLLKLVKIPGFMDGFNIKIVEGVQKLGTTDAAAADDSITKLSAIGRIIGFEVRNARSGELSPDVTFDLAAYIKDNCEYDKLILSYDTYEVDELSIENKILYASIIAVMPEMPQDYKIVFKQDIETIFNNEIQSTKDLVEVTLSDTGRIILEDPNTPPITKEGLKKIKTKKGYHTLVSGAVWDNFQGFINELEGSKYNYEINNIEGYSNTTQRYGSIPNEYIGKDLWTANASGLGININPSQNLKSTVLIHDFPAGIANIANKYGIGWGGNFALYKDTSLFSMRDEEGGSIPAPRINDVYTTVATRAEILKPQKVPISPSTSTTSNVYPIISRLKEAVEEGLHVAGSTVTYFDAVGQNTALILGLTDISGYGPKEYKVLSMQTNNNVTIYTAVDNTDPADVLRAKNAGFTT
jgi:hypothetical protein